MRFPHQLQYIICQLTTFLASALFPLLYYPHYRICTCIYILHRIVVLIVRHNHNVPPRIAPRPAPYRAQALVCRCAHLCPRTYLPATINNILSWV